MADDKVSQTDEQKEKMKLARKAKNQRRRANKRAIKDADAAAAENSALNNPSGSKNSKDSTTIAPLTNNTTPQEFSQGDDDTVPPVTDSIPKPSSDDTTPQGSNDTVPPVTDLTSDQSANTASEASSPAPSTTKVSNKKSAPPSPKVRFVVAHKDKWLMFRATHQELIRLKYDFKWAFFIIWELQQGDEIDIVQFSIDPKGEIVDCGDLYLELNEQGRFPMSDLQGTTDEVQAVLDVITVKAKFQAEAFGQLAVQRYKDMYDPQEPQSGTGQPEENQQDNSGWGQPDGWGQEDTEDSTDPIIENACIRDSRGVHMGILKDDEGHIVLGHMNDVHPRYPCQICSSIEHDLSYCPQRDPNVHHCLNCGRPHTEDNCDLALVKKCTVCLQTGHWRSQCPSIVRQSRPIVRHLQGIVKCEPRHRSYDEKEDLVGIGALTRNGENLKSDRYEHRLTDYGAVKARYVSASFAAVVTFSSADAAIPSDQNLEWAPAKFVGDYAEDYVSSMAQSFAPGLRTRVEIDNAARGVGSVRLIHDYCPATQEKGVTFAETWIEVPAIVKSPSLSEFQPDAFHDMIKVLNDKTYLPPKLPVRELTLMFQHTAFHEGVHHIERPEKIGELTGRYGEEFPLVVEQLRMAFGQTARIVSLSIFVPSPHPEPKEAWISLFRKYKVKNVNPYSDCWDKCLMPARYTDANQIPSDIELGVSEQENAQLWMTVREKATRLAIAAQRDYVRAEGTASITERGDYPAVCIKVPDVGERTATYPTNWLLILKNNNDLKAMPRPGDKVGIEFLNVEWSSHLQQPPQTLDDKVEIICKYIFAAEGRARDFGKRDASRAVFHQMLDEICVKKHVVKESRDKFILQKSESLLPRRGKEDKESVEDWKQRMDEFVRTHIDGLLQIPERHKPELMPCPATCISIPQIWRRIGAVGFEVSAPKTPGWKPEMGKDPHLQIKLPAITVSERYDSEKYTKQIIEKADDEKFMIRVAIHQKVTEDTLKAQLAGLAESVVEPENPSSFAKLMRWSANFHPAELEVADLTQFPILNHVIQRLQGIEFNKCVAARESLPEHADSSTDNQPQVANVADQPETQRDAESAVIDMDAAAAAQAQDLGQVNSESLTELRRGITEAQSEALLRYLEAADEHQRAAIVDGNENLPHGFKLIIGVPGGGKTWVVAFMLTLCLWEAQMDPQPLEEDASSKPEDSEHTVDKFAEALQKEQPKQKDARVPINTALVIAASNEQLNDAAAKIFDTLQRLDPDKNHLVIRAAPPTRVTGFMSRNETEQSVDELKRLLDPEQLITEMTTRMTRGVTPMVFQGPQSITNVIADMIEHDRTDIDIAQVRSNLETRKTDMIYWLNQGKKSYKTAMTKVIKAVLRRASVVVCTPFAASTMSNLIQPFFLWIDEVFRVSEADTTMVLSSFPSIKFKFLSGDPKQLGIEVLSANMHMTKDEDYYFLNVFAPQLEMSLAMRMLRTGAINQYRLRKNYRAVGFASAIASTVFYGKAMEEALVIPEDEYDNHPVGVKVKRTREFLQGLATAEMRGSSVWIDVTGETELNRSTSFYNEKEAQIIIEMVKSIFKSDLYSQAPTDDSPGKRASIAIVSPYSAQVDHIKQLLERLHPTEWVPELVMVRTARGMQGNEADIAIISLVRSSGVGFLYDAKLLNSMITRCLVANIIVGNSDMWNQKGMHPTSTKTQAIREIFNQHVQRAAVYVYKDKTAPFQGPHCAKCGSFHDTEKICRPVCVNCGLSHHVRNCTANPQPLTIEIQSLRPIHKWHSDDKQETAYVPGRGKRTFREIRGLEDDLKPRERLFRTNLDVNKMNEQINMFAQIRNRKKKGKGKQTEQEEEEEEVEDFLLPIEERGDETVQPTSHQQVIITEENEEVMSAAHLVDAARAFQLASQHDPETVQRRAPIVPIVPALEIEESNLKAEERQLIANYVIRRHATLLPTHCVIPLKAYWDLHFAGDDVAFVNYEKKSATIYQDFWVTPNNPPSVKGYLNEFPDQVMWFVRQKLKRMKHSDDTAGIVYIPIDEFLQEHFKDDSQQKLSKAAKLDRETEFTDNYGRKPDYVNTIPEHRDGVAIKLKGFDDVNTDDEGIYMVDNEEHRLRHFPSTTPIEPKPEFDTSSHQRKAWPLDIDSEGNEEKAPIDSDAVSIDSDLSFVSAEPGFDTETPQLEPETPQLEPDWSTYNETSQNEPDWSTYNETSQNEPDWSTYNETSQNEASQPEWSTYNEASRDNAWNNTEW